VPKMGKRQKIELKQRKKPGKTARENREFML
jgi:hypothetical protein